MRIAAIIAGGSVITATALAAFTAFSSPQAAGAPVSPLQFLPKSIIMLAKPQQAAPGAAQITQWIRDLANGSPAAQKRAERQLIAAGDAAVSSLKAASGGAVPPQQNKLLQSVLDDISVSDARHGPLVTFRSKNCSLHDALAAVCADAGLGCQLPRNCKRLSERFRINIQHQLFWNVLLRIAQATGISPKYGSRSYLEFSRHGLFADGALVAVNGAFAVAIESASLYRAKQRTKSGRRARVVRVVCCTFYLPEKGAFIQMGSPKSLLASYRKGRKLPVSSNMFSTTYYSIPAGEIISGYPGTLTIGPVAPASHAISRLVLNAPVAVSMDPEFQSDNNLNSGRAEIDAGGMRFLFGKPRLVKRQWGVAMNISTPPWLAKSLPVRAFLSRMPVFPPGPFIFTKADGHPIGSPSGYGHEYPTKRQYEFFPLTSKPAGVFVKTYARMAAVNVPFVFKNIPIPLSITSPPKSAIPQPLIITSESINVRSQPPTRTLATPIVMLAEVRHFRSTAANMSVWIHNLGDTSHAVRAAARKQLILAGDAAVPAVKTALNGWTTPRMRREMRSVLARIAQSDALRGPLVTLKLANARLRMILKRLCAQAGFSAQFVDLHLALAARRLTINVQRQPFWKVIQRIAMVTDVSPEGNDYWGTGFLTFYQPGAFAQGTPVYAHGALLLAVQRSSTDQMISFDADRGHRTVGGFGININGFWALGDSQVVQLGPVLFSRAVDDHGRSLLASTKAPVEVDFAATKYEFSFGPRLSWPFADSDKISDLKGELPITLAVAPRIRQIGHLDSGQATMRVNGIRISLGKPTRVVEDTLSPRVDRCTIHITVTPGANATGLPMTDLFMQSLPQSKSIAYTPSIGGVLGFKSKSGRQLSCRAGQQVSGSPWSYQVHVRGGLPAVAWAKVYTRFIRVHIPFGFHNLPIPGGTGVALKPMVAPEISNRPAPNPGSVIMLSGPRPTPIQAGQLAHWIHQLTSQSLVRRRVAIRHLAITGNAAIPSIQKALNHAADPARRRQLLSILDSITAADDLRGPLVSLNLQHASVRTALGQLCSQVGITEYYDQLPPSPLATYHIRRQPFWKVLERIAAMTHIGPVGNMYGDYRLRFGRGNLFASDVPLAVHGACTLAIESIRRYQNVWLVHVDTVNKGRSFVISCFALWAPRPNQILEQVGTLHATEIITDPHGNVLLAAPVKNTNNAWPSKQENLIFPLNIQLHWPPARAAALALRGNLRMYLSGDRRTLHITKLGFGHAALTDDGMNLVFGKLHKIPGGWKLHLHLRPVQGFFYHGKTNHWLPFAQMPIEHRFTHNLFDGKELRLYSADGHPAPISAHSGGRLMNGEWGVYRYILDIAGAAPKSASIKFFTRTVVVKVPFDFQKLPIPR